MNLLGNKSKMKKLCYLLGYLGDKTKDKKKVRLMSQLTSTGNGAVIPPLCANGVDGVFIETEDGLGIF